MLKNILNLNGAQKISKKEQRQIIGSGSSRVCCEWDGEGRCCAWGAGPPSTPCAFTNTDPNC